VDKTKQSRSEEGEDTDDQETGVQLHRTQAAVIKEGRAGVFYRWTGQRRAQHMKIGRSQKYSRG
jgi:hypothetical protein